MDQPTSVDNSSNSSSSSSYNNNNIDNAKSARKFKNPFAAPDPDSEDEPKCGMFGWFPAWLQLFSNMKVFMFCFVALGVFHGMSHSYMGAVLPSIERRFGFASSKIGTVKAMSDVSHIFAALIVGHYGGSGHRPRWISMGMFVLGLAMLLFAAPEIIFPVKGHSLTTAGTTKNTAGRLPDDELCLIPMNGTSKKPAVCTAGEQEQEGNLGPLIVFGVAEFLMGLGATTPMILGLPFVDDNVSYKSTPFYFTLSFAGRLFGPLMGFGLGAIFNSIYFDFSHPHFSQTDPRWISAWYLGFIVCGLGVCLFAVTIGCFPAVMPTRKSLTKSGLSKTESVLSTKTHNHHGKRKQEKVVLKDLPRNLKRLLTNSTYVIKLGSQLLEGLSIAGYMGFSQKFIQNQYRIAPSIASLAGGVPPVFAGFLGIAIGSTLIKRLKFAPRHVSMMTIVSAVIASACYFSVIGMGCDTPDIVGIGLGPGSPAASAPTDPLLLDLETCDAKHNCSCHSRQFSPVCDRLTNITYVSPCYAGCTGATYVNKTKFFTSCACVSNVTLFQDDPKFPFKQSLSKFPSHVVAGICPSTCGNFYQYIIVMCIAKFLMGIPLAGILMIQFRIVDYDLKSIANAVSSIVMSALGFLPAPIIAGFIIDSTCRFWQTSVCNVKGACLLYDVDAFRTKLHASVGVCKLLAAILDCLVTYKLWNVSFDRDEGAPPAGTETMIIGTELPTLTIQRDRQNSSDSDASTGTDTAASEQSNARFFSIPNERASGFQPVHIGLSKRLSYPITT
ncbi:Solute carrier organic anion transporter family member 3A1 [Hypsibius exemplaris]|uniref:Solute carrier organic anion transporter family member n=1 Tax=Hypsibius exemplaris TaxID=2072580 RepID=A0A1W0XAL2_HYPEX|nr:Solute carrier organic anion transporter family member 3A1 [Hypsibius exemplaris]